MVTVVGGDKAERKTGLGLPWLFPHGHVAATDGGCFVSLVWLVGWFFFGEEELTVTTGLTLTRGPELCHGRRPIGEGGLGNKEHGQPQRQSQEGSTVGFALNL